MTGTINWSPWQVAWPLRPLDDIAAHHKIKFRLLLNFIRRWSHIRISLEVQISCFNVILLVNFWKPICSLDLAFIKFWDACGKGLYVVVMFIPLLEQRSRDEVVVCLYELLIDWWRWILLLTVGDLEILAWNSQWTLAPLFFKHRFFFLEKHKNIARII